MLKKLLTILSLFCLLLISFPKEAGAQTLSESRETLIESLMGAPANTYTYEEVDAYLAGEEARVLETGDIQGDTKFGINGSHSTGQGLEIYSYLAEYFEANTSQSDQDALYPYAVDFDALPNELSFYRGSSDQSFADFAIVNKGNHLEVSHSWIDMSQRHQMIKYRGSVTNVGTQEVMVETGESVRPVKVNTQMKVNLESAHRTDYLFYFFYNDEGTLSLLMQQPQYNRETFSEAKTIISAADLLASGDNSSPTTTSWSLPDDWRMLSPRRGDTPPVAWVLTSAGDNETIAIEPAISGENVVSGFIHPEYSVQAYTTNSYSSEVSKIVTATPDENGYFTLNLDISVGAPPTVQILDKTGNIVFDQEMTVYQYRPTALAHESGYLTLERYFLNQDYVEGYTYPNATVSTQRLDGYATMAGPTVQADDDGYFNIFVQSHTNNNTTTIVSVEHPDTGEKISVAPYPWTQEELDNADW